MSMATATEGASSPQAGPAIHEEERASGHSGAVLYEPVIDFDAALARRKTGGDVVVRGDNHKANRRMALSDTANEI